MTHRVPANCGRVVALFVSNATCIKASNICKLIFMDVGNADLCSVCDAFVITSGVPLMKKFTSSHVGTVLIKEARECSFLLSAFD